MPIVRIENGQAVEERDLTMDDVPPHKRAMWRVLLGEQPDYDPDLASISEPVFQIEDDCVRRVWTVTAHDLDALKVAYCQAIDGEAEAIRSKYVTPGDGQSQEYAQVALEAMAVQHEDADPKRASYPMLAATARDSGDEAADLRAEAQAVLTKRAQWLAIGAEIRKRRVAGKAAIQAAASHQDVKAAYLAISWEGL